MASSGMKSSQKYGTHTSTPFIYYEPESSTLATCYVFTPMYDKYQTKCSVLSRLLYKTYAQ